MSELTNDQLMDEIQQLAAHIDAAVCEWLAKVAEFDRREIWAELGMASAAHWLSWRCSIAPGTAREQVRVARALETLPAVRAAFARGELSYSKVRAITRLEDRERGQEEEFLELAQYATAAQLERMVSAYRGVTREEAERILDSRHLSLMQNDDGSWTVRGRLPAEDGALLARALEAAREQTAEWDDVSAETRVRVPQGERDADALVVLADTMLANGPKERTAGDRYQVVVHVDAATLADAPTAPGDARCDLHDGPAARDTVRRLCCDAGLVPIIERNGSPLSVGRKTRAIPPAIRRALQARDGRCQFPGCTCSRWLDAHHIEHWARGGATELRNLVHLCRRHHRLVHEGNWLVERGRDGKLVFLNPHGLRITDTPRRKRGDCGDMVDRQRRNGIAPAADALLPGWIGERLDLGYAVDVLYDFAQPPKPRPFLRERPPDDDGDAFRPTG